MFINRQLFISRDIQWHVTVFSVFFVKVKVEYVWPTVRILITYILINCEWFIIKLCGIGIILLTDLLCGITSYYFSVDLRFDCIFNVVCAAQKWPPFAYWPNPCFFFYFDTIPLYTLSVNANTKSVSLDNLIEVCLWYCIETTWTMFLTVFCWEVNKVNSIHKSILVELGFHLW